MQQKLLKIVRTLETDYEPYGKVEREQSDCFYGCRHFAKLAGSTQQASPRNGRLQAHSFGTASMAE